MNHYTRAVGWLLLGMGVALSGVSLLGMGGLLAVRIDFFGFDLDTPTERIAWTVAWLLAAAAGLRLLVSGRRTRSAAGHTRTAR